MKRHLHTPIVAPLAVIAALTFIASVGVAEESDPQPEGSSETSESERLLIDYSGRFQDQSGAAISGVFHVAFKLYEDPDAADPVWSERQYVAVVDGTYTVPLGRNEPLREEMVAEERWIGVELVGEGEVVRSRLMMGSSNAASSPGTDALSETTQKWLQQAANDSDTTLAEVAKRAVYADRAGRADVANKVGSMSAEEVERLSNLAIERLGEHIADPDAHSATGRSLGDQTRVTEQVGGSGGSTYRTECPSGYVVTGITGGSGNMLDSIALICRRLQ